MFISPAYPAPSGAEIEAFGREQFCGKLIALDADGFPCVSLLPFVRAGDEIEVHLVQGDGTLAALRQRPRAAFLLDEALAFTPHHVIAQRDAGLATLHFRAVLFRVEAEVSTDPREVAGALERLLAVYQPGASWEPVAPGPATGSLYGERLRRLAVARLRIVGAEAKFKVGQNRTAAERERLLAYLDGRGLPGDARAAEVVRAAAGWGADGPADGPEDPQSAKPER